MAKTRPETTEARRRRRELLDADRKRLDAAIDEATAEALLRIRQRDTAQKLVDQADDAIGIAVRQLLGKGIGLSQVMAAQLTGLPADEVRRYTAARTRPAVGPERVAS